MGISRYFFICITVCSLLSSRAFSFDLYDSKEESELSFDQLKVLIEDQKLSSLEDVLENLKPKYPEFFKNYILMFHSRSLQGSSFENPRAILFDKSGEFVFTFNGNSEQRGYDRLEVMQFHEESRSFEFREISFSKDKEPHFSKANPEKCLVCHQRTDRVGVDTRPNWEPYNIWPGAYGGISGNLKLSYYHKNLESLKNADSFILESAEIEGEKLESFFNNVHASHSRYKFLDKEAFEPRQTVAFTELQNRLGFKRVTRIITEDFKNVYESISSTLAAGIRCGTLAVSRGAYEWLSNNWGEEEFRPGSSTTYNSTTSLKDEKGLYYFETHREIDSGAATIKRTDIDFENIFPKVNTSELLHHLFEPLGISTKDWSLDFKTGGRLAFRERFGTPSNTQANFRNAFKDQFRTDGLIKINCSLLKTQSAKQFDEFMNSELFKRLLRLKSDQVPVDDKPVISRCISCHESQDSAIPQIPFSDPLALKEKLLTRASLSSRLLIDEIKYRTGDFAKEEERMPLGPLISKQQRSDLIYYLDSILY